VPRPYLPRTQRREQILDATEALMAAHGIQSVTMARIAAAVGLTPGALYRHFRSRGEIVAAIVRRDLEELAAVDASDLPRYLAAESRRYLADPGYARVRRELLYLASLDPDFGAQALAYEADLVARVGARHEVEVRAAQLVLDGLSLRADREGRFDPSTEAAVHLLFRLLADAAGPPPADAAGAPATEETP
jgi:AcrR family transcriptional regulator